MKNTFYSTIFKINIAIASFLLLFVTAFNVHAQGCCSPGSPSLGVYEQGLVQAKQMSIGIFYESNYLGNTYQGSKKATDPLQRKARVQVTSLQLSYGLNRRITANVVTTYNNKQREITTTGIDGLKSNFSFKGQGLGDVALLGKFNLIPLDVINQREFSLGIGVKIPTGEYQKKIDDVKLSIDLQPGTGSLDGLLWGYFYQGFLPVRINMFGSATFRNPTENSDGYRLGQELNYYLGTTYNCFQLLDFLAQFRGRLAGRDSYEGRELPSTGGHWIYLLLGSNFNLFSNFTIQTYGQIPIYRNVYGIQLTPSYSFVVAGYYNINF